MDHTQSFRKLAKVYLKLKKDTVEPIGGTLQKLLKKLFEKWIERKFTYVNSMKLREWGIVSGAKAYWSELLLKKVNFHTELDHGDAKWVNEEGNTMKKWAWNLRRPDDAKDKRLQHNTLEEPDATVPKDDAKNREVIVVGGHSSLIKAFLMDDSIWPNENLYLQLIEAKLNEIAYQKRPGKWRLKEEHADKGIYEDWWLSKLRWVPRVISDLKDNKLLNCQAVYLKMEVSGEPKDATGIDPTGIDVKVRDFKEVYVPDIAQWT